MIIWIILSFVKICPCQNLWKIPINKLEFFKVGWTKNLVFKKRLEPLKIMSNSQSLDIGIWISLQKHKIWVFFAYMYKFLCENSGLWSLWKMFSVTVNLEMINFQKPFVISKYLPEAALLLSSVKHVVEVSTWKFWEYVLNLKCW